MSNIPPAGQENGTTDRLSDKWFSRIGRSLSIHLRPLLPDQRIRRGAGIAILAMIALLALSGGIGIRMGLGPIFNPVGGVILLLLLALLIGIPGALLLRVSFVVPRLVSWGGVVGAIALMAFIFSFLSPIAAMVALSVCLLLAAVLGGSLAAITRPGLKSRPLWQKLWLCGVAATAFITVVILVVWLAGPGNGSDPVAPAKGANLEKANKLKAPDPSRPGNLKILTLTYGSGNDPRRPEFCAGAALRTPTVDATPFVGDLPSWQAAYRKWYWGFDASHFPLNGTVWYPEGHGPFPLVLIVHGNHQMEVPSDTGYGYLGRLLASRGYIAVSIDENFLNGSLTGDLEQENGARAWILLKHLQIWRQWNSKSGNPFYHRIDLDRIALIGHSRGGEAVAVAGMFNRLAYYPDDASVEFDFYFNIRAIVAISPSDSQYLPAGQNVRLDNINYLVLQGGHDADVDEFVGDNQYNRISFTNEQYWIKSSLYARQANHVQFNTAWGVSDLSWPEDLLLNRKGVLKPEDQRKIAKTIISAFLDAAVKAHTRYLPLFQNPVTGTGWMPGGEYIGRFEDSTFSVIANFDEDADVTTTTVPNGWIQPANLSFWREQDLPFRDGDSRGNNVVALGWDNASPHPPATQTPFYEIVLPAGMASELALNAQSTLTFAAADAEEPPTDNTMPAAAGPDFSIELETVDGVAFLLPLERFGSIPPNRRVRFSKFGLAESDFGLDWEPVLKTIQVPLHVFMTQFPDFSPERLKIIRFVFDRRPSGTIFLDEIGFMQRVPRIAPGDTIWAPGLDQ